MQKPFEIPSSQHVLLSGLKGVIILSEWAAEQDLISPEAGPFWHQAWLYPSDGTKLKHKCSIVISCGETFPLRALIIQCYSLVGMWPSRVRGSCGPPVPPLSMASPAVAQDTVSTSTSLFVIISFAFRWWLSELSGLLVNTAAWNKTWVIRMEPASPALWV